MEIGSLCEILYFRRFEVVFRQKVKHAHRGAGVSMSAMAALRVLSPADLGNVRACLCGLGRGAAFNPCGTASNLLPKPLPYAQRHPAASLVFASSGLSISF